MALDKTGTVTQGRPELTELILAGGFKRADVLSHVAAVEVQSEHPIAQAIVCAAQAEKTDQLEKTGFYRSPATA
uniref:HAD family hydrolase n=1 Tax=Aliiroseovarius crassostreae TaxID=154981 RepID=UPI0035CD1E88